MPDGRSVGRAKRDPPVLCDLRAPDAFALPRQPVGFPNRDGKQFILVRHVLQEQDRLAS